jgi:hypothetical protein
MKLNDLISEEKIKKKPLLTNYLDPQQLADTLERERKQLQYLGQARQDMLLKQKPLNRALEKNPNDADLRDRLDQLGEHLSWYQIRIDAAQTNIDKLEKQLEKATKSGAKTQNMLEKLADKLQSECSDYLSAFAASKKVMWRGASETNPQIFLGRSPANRNPMDSSRSETLMFNKILSQLNIQANRSNSIFVTSDLYSAGGYGEVYAVVPKNTAKFAWSKKHSDIILYGGQNEQYLKNPITSRLLTKELTNINNWYTQEGAYSARGRVMREQWMRIFRRAEDNEPITAAQSEFLVKNFPKSLLIPHLDYLQRQGKDVFNLEKFQKHFQMTDSDLPAALKSGHEIMIHGEYYAIRRKIWEKIKKIIEGTAK